MAKKAKKLNPKEVIHTGAGREFKVVRCAPVGRTHVSATFQSTDTESARVEFEVFSVLGSVNVGDLFELVKK